MNYLGEWTQEDLDNMTEDSNGQEYLTSILSKDAKVEVADIWDDIGDNVAVFVFQCNNCNLLVAMWQCF
ncbi:hypothetical protein Clocel_2302 [Clostridium cellulovorans 743B]|uniref:Uncharacterized protein n=1 Tax=Clostridium cellulovorans (strain ATCC 35296 / DSM 3052 / OCM 3 / 743B) TaxID=573061 RepID=D9SP63_CLOC7|nr:hypothetical protein Clocel_2302 [Clostridium cellulovorans 743B]